MGKIRKRIKKRIENSLNFGLMQYKQWFKRNIMRLVNILVIRVLPQLSVIIVISHVPQLCFKQLPATSSIHCTFYHF